MNHGTLSVINLFQFAVKAKTYDDNHVKAKHIKRTRLSPEFPNGRPLTYVIYHQHEILGNWRLQTKISNKTGKKSNDYSESQFSIYGLLKRIPLIFPARASLYRPFGSLSSQTSRGISMNTYER